MRVAILACGLLLPAFGAASGAGIAGFGAASGAPIVLSAAAADHTYRWVDEHGAVNYGEKPPAGRPARAVNVQPAGTVESRGLPVLSAVETSAVLPASAAVPAPRGMEFATYIRLQPGMTEGELLLRAGPPDHESVESTRDIAKSLYYYPTAANPWLTVVHVRGGRVANIERNRKTN